MLAASLSLFCPRHNSMKASSLHAGARTLTLTTSVGIWSDADATKSWSSVISLSCSCRISLCIRSNYDFGGWATRIIYFSLFIFSTVFITLIRQETIGLSIRNHSFWPPVEGRLTLRERLNLLQSTVYNIHSVAKSKAVTVSERSQRHLSNNSNYTRHDSMTVTSIPICLYLHRYPLTSLMIEPNFDQETFSSMMWSFTDSLYYLESIPHAFWSLHWSAENGFWRIDLSVHSASSQIEQFCQWCSLETREITRFLDWTVVTLEGSNWLSRLVS